MTKLANTFNVNALKTILFFATLLLAGNAEAVPGEQFKETKEQFEANEIFQGAELRIHPLSEIVGYNLRAYITVPVLIYTTSSSQESRVPELRGTPFHYSVSFDEQQIVLEEDLFIESEFSSGNLSSNSYNPRQDSFILNLLESVWNSDVSSDFSQARYTDSFELGGSSIRKLYRGEIFGYQLSSEINSQSLSIQIFPVRFTDNYSILTDYEIRL